MEQRFPLGGRVLHRDVKVGHTGSLLTGDAAEGGHREAEAARGAAALGAAQWQVHHPGRLGSPLPELPSGAGGGLTLFPLQSVRDPSGASIALFTAKLHHPSKSVQHVVLQALFYLLDRAVER